MKLVLDGYVPPLLVLGAALLLLAVRRLYVGRDRRHAKHVDVAIMVAILGCAAFLELEMGRTPKYRYGPVRLWSGDTQSNQNSQQIADPYTFTHVIHGAAFYGLTHLAMRSAPLTVRLIAAITVESAWEAVENTDMVINRYRAATISLDYYGDSIINSVADVLACVIGFLLTRRLPVRVTVMWIVLVEVILAVWIRDNLTLNILMLLHPVQAIRTWQMGA